MRVRAANRQRPNREALADAEVRGLVRRPNPQPTPQPTSRTSPRHAPALVSRKEWEAPL